MNEIFVSINKILNLILIEICLTSFRGQSIDVSYFILLRKFIKKIGQKGILCSHELIEILYIKIEKLYVQCKSFVKDFTIKMH